ncbi:hypothetical protein, partial [Nocardioides sp. P5_C9_2]
AKLVRAWRPASQGQSFLWREVTEEQSLEVRLYQAESALEELQGTVGLNADLAEAFGLTQPSDTPQLIALVAHQHTPHPLGVMEQWLTAESSQPLVSARDNLGRQIAQLKAAEADVIEVAGVPWTALPDAASVAASPETVAASPSPIDLHPVSAADLTSTADRFETDSRMLGERLGSLSSLAVGLGLPPISTFADVDRLTRLIDLCSQNNRPDRRWFTPTGLAEARAAATALRAQTDALKDAETTALSVFTADALKAPLAELQDRFTNLHKGLKKLSGNYRTDKRLVAGLLTTATDVKTGISHLSDAITWGETSKAFENLASTRGDNLGAHWAGRETDFEAANASFNVVEEILTLTANNVPAALVTYMTSTGSNETYQSVADTARADLDAWKRALAPAPALS